MNTNTTYLAITIGPIYKTMKMARKTREFWAGSMLFSLLARELCAELHKQHTAIDFLVPSPNLFSRKIINVGLYLDRIICKVPDNFAFDSIETDIFMPALNNLAAELNTVSGVAITAQELKSYFNIYALLRKVTSEKPLSEISEHLNTMEVYDKNASNSGTIDGQIKSYMENVNTEYDEANNPDISNFLEEYFEMEDFNGNIRVPSITEVCTYELRTKLVLENKPSYKNILNKTIWKKEPSKKWKKPEITENELFPKLKDSFGIQVKNYHKYYCIIQADGDKLGKTLLGATEQQVKDISKDLIDWGEATMDKLIAYGALPIYIGGDDVFCFAPVNNGKTHILDLVNELNSTYNEKEHLNRKSTLSISIKVSYYKSPMYESYMDTFSLLKEAKKHKIKKDDKDSGNSCCCSFDKHSGQPHTFTYSFAAEYQSYIKPIADEMLFSEKEKSFLSSVMYTLRANEELMFEICSKIEPERSERLWAFFQNIFDEAKERNLATNKYRYLKGIKNLLLYLFAKYGNAKEDTSQMYQATIQLYSILKFLRFIKGLDDDKE